MTYQWSGSGHILFGFALFSVLEIEFGTAHVRQLDSTTLHPAQGHFKMYAFENMMIQPQMHIY